MVACFWGVRAGAETGAELEVRLPDLQSLGGLGVAGPLQERALDCSPRFAPSTSPLSSAHTQDRLSIIIVSIGLFPLSFNLKPLVMNQFHIPSTRPVACP